MAGTREYLRYVMKSIRNTEARMMLDGLPLKSPALNELAEQNSASKSGRSRCASVFLENSKMMGVRVRTTISLLVVRVKMAANNVNRDKPRMLGFLDASAALENLFAMYTKHFVYSAEVHTYASAINRTTTV